MSSFEEYLRQGEAAPGKRAQAWQAAIGLQDVDGLKTSEYLVQTARRHIEGDITIGEAKALIDTYYRSKDARGEVEARTEEASPKCNNCTLDCTLEEMALLSFVEANPKATQKQMAEHLRCSECTVKTMTVKLQNAGALVRVNGRRSGWWEVKKK